MSVASRIFDLLRTQALSASRALRERAQRGRPSSSPGDASSRHDPGQSDTGYDAGWQQQRQTDAHSHRSRGSQGRSTTQNPNLGTYYANLELPYGAGREEVEAAWKRQARRYHPDRFASDPERHAVATELLQGINLAYTEICRHLDAQGSG